MGTPNWLISLVYNAVRTYFLMKDRAFFIRLEGLVIALFDSSYTGEQKAAKVREAIKAEWEGIQPSVLNWLLEIVVAQAKTKFKK